MLSSSTFREFVNGQRRGSLAALARLGLRLAEFPYTWVVRWRNRGFDVGRIPVAKVNVPVISVGNLTMGGTGKTPVVEWLARWFRQREVRVSILSRGYGAGQSGMNDEALQLALNLEDVPHLQNPDRVASAQIAMEEFFTQLILLDDGFQHRRLARDLDVVLLDALEPFGWEHVFPRGTLREPLSGLSRASVVLLSRADLLSAAERLQIQQRVNLLSPHSAWAEIAHAPQTLINADGQLSEFDTLKNIPVAAFCGLGNPAGFRHTLERLGYDAVHFQEFPDHYTYQRADIQSLTEIVSKLGVQAVLCTQKDLVKISLTRLGKIPLWAVKIGIEFLAGEAELEKLLVPLAEKAEKVEYEDVEF